MVMITGSGWAPGETVALEIVGDPPIPSDSPPPPDTLYAVADDAGNITNEYIVPGRDVLQTFTLTASGMTSGLVSQTTFTNSLDSAPPPAPDIPTTTSPTVMTDKQDYVPGETVLITGSGWAPGETVALEFVETPLIHPAETLYVIADDTGNITNAEYVIQDHDIGQTFTLTATGLTSGLTAQTIFTDAITLQSRESTCTTETNSFATGATVCMRAAGIGGPFPKSGEFKWWAPGLDPNTAAATRTQGFTTSVANLTDSFTVANCGTWTVRVFQPAGTLQATDTFDVTGCAVCGNTIVETGEQCDDGNTSNGDCCSSTCQFEAGGTACTTDGNECTDDECDGSGLCAHNNDDTNTCGDQVTDTDCDNLDTCSAGACQNNNEAPGTACGSSSDTECDDPDTCDGTGVCQPNVVNNCLEFDCHYHIDGGSMEYTTNGGPVTKGTTHNYLVHCELDATGSVTNIKVQGGLTVSTKSSQPTYSFQTNTCDPGDATINISKNNNVFTVGGATPFSLTNATCDIEVLITGARWGSIGTYGVTGSISALHTDVHGVGHKPYVGPLTVNVMP